MKICIYGAASNKIDKEYLDAGFSLGLALGKQGHSLVFGGGANGMMGAVARGIKKENGHITSVAPNFFNVDGVLYDKCSKYIYTDTMRERKQLMEELSDAFIITPGGIGTFEEFFEIFTLRQLNRHQKPIAILNTNNYYKDIIAALNHAIKENFMDKRNLDLLFVSDNNEKIIEYLENAYKNPVDSSDFR